MNYPQKLQTRFLNDFKQKILAKDKHLWVGTSQVNCIVEAWCYH